MLLNLTWLIPGLPIIASIFIAMLLLSFSKTMNRLTKPVSFILIVSVVVSEVINFILFKKHVSGSISLFGDNLSLLVDKPALIFSLSIGFLFLSIMLFSLNKLERRIGYVRYFISLGFLCGFVYLFSFSGNIFHNFYDPLMSSLDKLGFSIS